MKCFKCFQYSLSYNYLQETCSLTILCWQPPGSGSASSASNNKMNWWPLSISCLQVQWGEARPKQDHHLECCCPDETSPLTFGLRARWQVSYAKDVLSPCLPRSVFHCPSRKHNASWPLLSLPCFILFSLCPQLEKSRLFNSQKCINDSGLLMLSLAARVTSSVMGSQRVHLA